MGKQSMLPLFLFFCVLANDVDVGVVSVARQGHQ